MEVDLKRNCWATFTGENLNNNTTESAEKKKAEKKDNTATQKEAEVRWGG